MIWAPLCAAIDDASQFVGPHVSRMLFGETHAATRRQARDRPASAFSLQATEARGGTLSGGRTNQGSPRFDFSLWVVFATGAISPIGLLEPPCQQLIAVASQRSQSRISLYGDAFPETVQKAECHILVVHWTEVRITAHEARGILLSARGNNCNAAERPFAMHMST